MDELRQKIIAASRILYAPNGITSIQTDFSGHVSGRLPDQGTYFIVGHIHHTGRSNLGHVQYKDLIEINVNTGQKIQGKHEQVEESIIHTAIYRARRDVNGIIHTHPFWCTVWSLVDKPTLGLPSLHTDKFLISSEHQGEELIETLGDEMACLISGHGLVTVGETVEEACTLTIQLEDNARLLYHASVLGSIPKHNVQLIQKIEHKYRWHVCEKQLKEKGKHPGLPR